MRATVDTTRRADLITVRRREGGSAADSQSGSLGLCLYLLDSLSTALLAAAMPCTTRLKGQCCRCPAVCLRAVMRSHACQVPHESATSHDAGHCKHLMHHQSPSPPSHLQRGRTNPQSLGSLPQADAELDLEVLQLEPLAWLARVPRPLTLATASPSPYASTKFKHRHRSACLRLKTGRLRTVSCCMEQWIR